jgi:hypothetical protein
MKRRTSSDTLIPLRFASLRKAASWTSERNIEMRFMSCMYNRHTYLSREIRVPTQNNSPVRRRRYAKTEIENSINERSPCADDGLSDRCGHGARGVAQGGGRKRKAGGFARGSIHARNFRQFDFCGLRPTDARRGLLRRAGNYCSFAYSALACFRIGMSGSASFQSMRKS